MTSPAEEGNPDARIAIVGEAPGTYEMSQGRPLVGPSGRLFNWCLHGAGIARGECYIVNVWPYQIKKKEHNDGSATFFRSDGVALWNKKEGFTEAGREDSRGTVERLLASDANVLCPLGEAALNLVSDHWQVTKWRGSIVRGSNEMAGRKVVATRHPAASLRGDFALRYIIRKELERVREQSRFTEIRLPQRELITSPSLDDVLGFIGACIFEREPTATDIEVMNHQVDCLSLSNDPSLALCIPFIKDNQHYWSEEQELRIWLAYADLMRHPEITKVNQNVLFDIAHLLDKNHIHTRGRLCDPMVGHSLLHPWTPKGLDFLCSIYTEEPYYKDDGKFWDRPDWDWNQRFVYNAKDSAIALECWQEIEPELIEKGMMETHDRTTASFPYLTYMMLRGLKVNVEEKIRTRDRVTAEINELVEAFHEKWGFNPKSDKEVHAHFYEELGIKPYTNTKTKQPTVDEEALSRLWRTHGREEAQEIGRIRELSKLRGTYLEMVLDDDNRLRSSYNPRGAWPGRLSSSKTVHGYGGNAQNLDPEFRSFIEAG